LSKAREIKQAMTRFSKQSGALAVAGIALSLVLPLVGCGSGHRGTLTDLSAASRKVGTIDISVTWPERTKKIPVAANSIVVSITDSKGRSAPGFPKTLVRPADISGSPTIAATSATNLEVGPDASTNETYTISAKAYPGTDGTGVAQAVGGTTVGLNVTEPDKPVRFALFSEIKSVVVAITDGSTTLQNLGKGRTRPFLATARNAAGDVVITLPNTIEWRTTNLAAGAFIKSDGTTGSPVKSFAADNSIVFLASDPGASPITTQIYAKATDTEAGIESAATNLTVVPLGLASTAWARFHGDKSNQGIGSAGPTISATPTLAWATPVSGVLPSNFVLSSSVIGSDGTVYIGGYVEDTGKNGQIYAIRPDGTLKWTFGANGKVEATPVISRDGTIYFGSFSDAPGGGGFIYGLRDNGSGADVLWRVATKGPVLGSMALDQDGYLYFGTGGTDNSLYKVDSLNGNPFKLPSKADWTPFKASSEVVTSPALSSDEKAVYFATSDGNLYAVNTQTGASAWSGGPYASGESVYASSPMVAGGKVFFGTIDGKLHAVDAATGASAWSTPFDVAAQIYATPTISKDGTQVIVASFDNVSGVDENKVRGISVATGLEVWSSASLPAGITSSPALSADGSVLYFGCYDGKVYGVTATGPTAGNTLWSYLDPAGVPSEQFDSSPAIGPNGEIYIGSFKGKVYALRP
jgi:outer membrane protein assembly factor BamB